MSSSNVADPDAEQQSPDGVLMSPRRYTIFCQTLLVMLCFAGYYHGLLGSSYVFDDTVAVVKNKDVTTEGSTNLSAVFQHDFWGARLTDPDSHKSYRPLTTLMFRWEYKQGFQPKHMKGVNLLIHCVNSLLVWHLLRDLQYEEQTLVNGEQVAIIAAVLFSIHPVHTEAVCGIVSRAELMFALAYLLALMLHKCKDKLGSVLVDGGVVTLTVIGILFKETAITIPLACAFYSYMKRKVYLQSVGEQLKHIGSASNMFYMAATLMLLVGRMWIQHFQGPSFKPMDNPIAFDPDPLTRILSQHYLYVVNLWIMLCPQWLCFDWALGCVELVRSMWDLRLQSVLALYSLAIVTVLYYRSSFAPLLAGGLIVIPFLPASGIIKVGFVIAERVLYVPSIGFCLLVAYGFVYTHNALDKYKWVQKQMKWFLMLVLVTFLLRTRQRSLQWQTEEKLFASALKVCPNNAKVHYNIARLASDRQESDKALQHYHKSIELYPQYESALMNLGNLYRERGELANAEKFIRASLDVLPDFATAWMNLGIVQSAQRKYTEARKSYENALKYRPKYAVCHYNLGNLFLDQKQYAEAMHHWQEAVTLNPRQPKAWANILTMLDNRGLHEDAVRLSAKALKHLPNDTGLSFIRANVLGKLQRYIEAETLYQHVIRVEPVNMLFHTNLGVLYHRWGKYEEAIESYKRAIVINPTKSQTARENLSKLLKRLRDEADQKKSQAAQHEEQQQ